MKRTTVCVLTLAIVLIILCAGPFTCVVGIDLPDGFSMKSFSLFSDAATVIDSGSCGDMLTYTLDNDGLLTISGTGDLVTARRDEYSGAISYVTPWKDKKSMIKKVVVESGVTGIDTDAFAYCENLTDISIADSVLVVRREAFHGTPWYDEQPEGVVYIGKIAYSYKGNMPADAEVVLKDVTIAIADESFANCSEMRSIVIPEGVLYVGNYAFMYCSNLQDIYIPDSVKIIGDNAFKSCSGLKEIYISKGVEYIGEDPFVGCSNLKNINVATDNSVFCSENGVLYNKDKTSLYRYPIAKDELQPVVLPASVVRIEDHAFWGCKKVKEVNLPENISFIGQSAFCSSSIEYFEMPDNVDSELSFNNCTKLKNVVLANDIKTIPATCFSDCYSLEAIVIPENVTSIGKYAFYDCSALTEIVIPASVQFIGESAFSYCSKLTNIKVVDDNSYFSSENGMLFDKNKTKLYTCVGGKAGSVSIPVGVVSIENGAFAGCAGVTYVEIPFGVTKINEQTFLNCKNLEKITIPGTLREICYYTFVNCNNLNTVEFMGTKEQWDAIIIDEYNDAFVAADVQMHSWDDGTIIKAASCASREETLYVCKECGREKTEITSSMLHADANADGFCDDCNSDLYLVNAPYKFGADAMFYSRNPEKGVCFSRNNYVYLTTPDLCIDDIRCNIIGETHYGGFGLDITAYTPILDVMWCYTILRDGTQQSYQFALFADCDGDENLSSADAREALRHSVGLELIADEKCRLAADVDFDNKITASDARLILRMSVGLDDPKAIAAQGIAN